MLMLGLLNLLLAVGVVAGLVVVCLVPRLLGPATQVVATEQQAEPRPERLAA